MLQELALLIIAIFFAIINYKILVQDWREHIIKNKYLFILFLLFIPYFFIWNFEILNVIYNFFWILFLVFILYSLRIWWAWDAKYLLVLSMYLSQIHIFSFIWNIAIITLLLLIGLFIKNIFIKNNKWEYLHSIIIRDIISKEKHFLDEIKSWRNNMIFSILNSLNAFFLIFIVIRLLRITLIEKYWYLFIKDGQIQIVLILLLIFFSILLFLWLRKIFQRLKKYMSSHTNFTENEIQSIWNIVFFIITSTLLYIDFLNNKATFFEQMYRIFTLYLFIYIIVKFFIYIYQKSFIDMERITIHVSELQVWDIIDRQFYQKSIQNISKKNLFHRNMKEIEDVDNIRKLILKNYPETPQIIISQTFAFSVVVFTWFITTFIYDNFLVSYLYTAIKDFIATIYF